MSSLSFSVLRIRDFRLLLLVRTFGMMAMQAQTVIIGWQVYMMTKDPFLLGMTGLAEAVPAIACALVAGHIVDISRPYIIHLACIGALTLIALVFLLFAGGFVPVPFGSLLGWMFALIFLSGLARSFIMPASFSLLSQVVSRADIPATSAWLSSGFQFAAIGGPAIAGLVYGGYGERVAWLLPAGLMGISFLLLFGMNTHAKRYKSGEKREPAVKSIRAGWKFIFDNPVLLAVMALDMFAVFFGGAVAMLPAFADQVLHVGSEGLGALRAAPAIGAIATALYLAVRPFKQIHATTLLWMVTGFGVCMIGFGLSTTLWAAIVMLALSGAFDSVSMVIRGTLVQWLTPESMRGRVSAVNSMFIISSNELGAFESGVAAKWLGLVPSIVLGGLATLFIVAATAGLSPKLRKTRVEAEE